MTQNTQMHEDALAFYGNLPYTPPAYPERPLDLLQQGRLGEMIPNVENRQTLYEFLSNELPYHADPERQQHRHRVRDAFLDTFGLSHLHPYSFTPKIPIKMGIFDVDDNIAKLYEPANSANRWAAIRLRDKHHVPLGEMQNAVKSTIGEYGCHAPYELLHIVANKLNRPELSPDNPANYSIVADWRYARLALTSQALFKETIPIMQQMKETGSLVYLSTASMPASLGERLYLWFGDKNIGLIDGIAVSKTLPPAPEAGLPGIPQESVFATPEERAFCNKLRNNDKWMEVDLDKVKPHPEHVAVCLDHANRHLPVGAYKITPKMCFLADDSSSALGSARILDMHSILHLKSIMADPWAREVHNGWGCNRNHRGLDAFEDRFVKGEKSDLPVPTLDGINGVCIFVPAYADVAPVEPLAWKQLMSVATAPPPVYSK